MFGKLLNFLDKILTFFEEWTLFVTVMVALVALFVNVVLRYGFNYSLAWSEELVREVIIYTTFIGCSAAVKNRSLIKIDASVQLLPKLKMPLTYFSNFVTMIFAGMMIYYGWLMVPLAMVTALATSPGQTYGVSVFNPSLREALAISHSQLTGAYMLGTLLAALPQPFFGKLMDRLGIRRLSGIVVVALGVCIVCSLLVSTAAVTLNVRQERNKMLEKLKNILQAGDLLDKGPDITKIYEQYIEGAIINLETGEEISENMYSDVLNAQDFDIKTILKCRLK